MPPAPPLATLPAITVFVSVRLPPLAQQGPTGTRRPGCAQCPGAADGLIIAQDAARDRERRTFGVDATPHAEPVKPPALSLPPWARLPWITVWEIVRVGASGRAAGDIQGAAVADAAPAALAVSGDGLVIREAATRDGE